MGAGAHFSAHGVAETATWSAENAGLVLSTLTVHLVSTWAQASGWGRLARTGAVEATRVATFGSLWALQYALCDRVLFRSGEPSRRQG